MAVTSNHFIFTLVTGFISWNFKGFIGQNIITASIGGNVKLKNIKNTAGNVKGGGGQITLSDLKSLVLPMMNPCLICNLLLC